MNTSITEILRDTPAMRNPRCGPDSRVDAAPIVRRGSRWIANGGHSGGGSI